MEKLKFYAREDLLVSEPFHTRIQNQPARYVGRKFDPRIRGYVAKQEPSEYELDSHAALRLMKIVRFNDPSPLFPADEYTARKCGVDYKEVVFKDGAWVDSYEEHQSDAEETEDEPYEYREASQDYE